MSTIEDVAKRANVSIATVSRVLNQSAHKVSKETTKKVLKAVKELDYHPNAMARALQNKRTMTVGVIIPDISNVYYAEIVKGIQNVGDREGYNIILQNTDRNQDRIVKSIYLLREKMTDGIIFSGGTIDGYKPLSALKELRDRVVVIGRHEVNFPAIVVDNIAGATHAVQHLIDQGHEHIAFLGNMSNSSTVKDRLTGYKNALAQNSIPYKKLLIFNGNLKPESGYKETRKMLRLKRKPTAIFAANDLMAYGAIHAVTESGLKVPDDIAVVGFDNIPMSSFYVPSLSTVEVPMFKLGATAMETLIRVISGRDYERINLHKTKLLIKQSSVKN